MSALRRSEVMLARAQPACPAVDRYQETVDQHPAPQKHHHLVSTTTMNRHAHTHVHTYTSTPQLPDMPPTCHQHATTDVPPTCPTYFSNNPHPNMSEVYHRITARSCGVINRVLYVAVSFFRPTPVRRGGVSCSLALEASKWCVTFGCPPC